MLVVFDIMDGDGSYKYTILWLLWTQVKGSKGNMTNISLIFFWDYESKALQTISNLTNEPPNCSKGVPKSRGWCHWWSLRHCCILAWRHDHNKRLFRDVWIASRPSKVFKGSRVRIWIFSPSFPTTFPSYSDTIATPDISYSFENGPRVDKKVGTSWRNVKKTSWTSQPNAYPEFPFNPWTVSVFFNRKPVILLVSSVQMILKNLHSRWHLIHITSN